MSIPAKFKSQSAPSNKPEELDPLGDVLDIADAFANQPPPLDFILPGFLRRTVAVVAGQGGGGKSFLQLQIAMAIAGGRDMLEMGIEETGRVLYISREDPLEVLRHRMHAIGKFFDADSLAAAAANIIIRSGVGRGFDITQKPHQDRVIKECGDVGGVRLIAFDTLSRCHSKEENSNAEMSYVLQCFERIAVECNAGVMLAHHVNKTSVKENGGDQTAFRGAAVITDNARWGITLVKMSKTDAEKLEDPSDPGHAIGDARGRYALLGGASAKNNYGENGMDRWLRRERGGVLVPVFLEPWDKPKGGEDGPQKPSKGGRKYRDKEQSNPNSFRPPRRGSANIMGVGADQFNKQVKDLEAEFDFEKRFADAPTPDPTRVPVGAKESDDDCPF